MLGKNKKFLVDNLKSEHGRETFKVEQISEDEVIRLLGNEDFPVLMEELQLLEEGHLVELGTANYQFSKINWHFRGIS